jgi:hypothetical protein
MYIVHQLESQHHQRSPRLARCHSNGSFEHVADVDLDYLSQEEVMAFNHHVSHDETELKMSNRVAKPC